MKSIMVTCKTASELTEKKLHSGLGCAEMVQWKFHTLMCSTCRRYAKESEFLGKALEETHTSGNVLQVPDQEVEKLIRRILDRTKDC